MVTKGYEGWEVGDDDDVDDNNSKHLLRVCSVPGAMLSTLFGLT